VPDRLLVLGWHNAEPTPFFPSPPGACARGLARQLRAVKRMGTVVPLDEALDAMAQGRPLPRRAIALTFDDGYRDNLETALPILSRLGLPATFYLVPGLLDRSVRAWWEVLAWAFRNATALIVEWRGRRLTAGPGEASRTTMLVVAEELKRMPRAARDAEIDALIDALRPTGSEDEVAGLYLDWDGARALAAGGGTVGSHTMAHAILSEEPPDDQAADLAESRRALEEGLGVPARTLAYPNGTAADYDESTLDAAVGAGYEGAVTTIDGWNDPATPRLELRRFVLEPTRGLNGLRPVVRAPGVMAFARGR
jgi:peptidoglycan/xylan/chitin deacetylase (PgdA/CDA1 family)